MQVDQLNFFLIDRIGNSEGQQVRQQCILAFLIGE